jgi:hypothetical protein
VEKASNKTPTRIVLNISYSAGVNESNVTGNTQGVFILFCVDLCRPLFLESAESSHENEVFFEYNLTDIKQSKL